MVDQLTVDGFLMEYSLLRSWRWSNEMGNRDMSPESYGSHSNFHSKVGPNTSLQCAPHLNQLDIPHTKIYIPNDQTVPRASDLISYLAETKEEISFKFSNMGNLVQVFKNYSIIILPFSLYSKW